MNHFPLTLIIFILSIPAYSDTPPPSSTDRLKEGTANLYFTTTRARNSVSASSPLLYTGGTFSIPAATSSANGYLTSGNWTLFNSKEPPLASGLSTQYFRGDKTWALLDTSSVPENGNLYFTNGRVDTEFDTRLATKSTSNLAEGSNLYFTNARVDTEFDTRLATKSTTNLAEGSNLYFTNARAQTAVTASLTAKEVYVSKDTGSDSNSGSLIAPFRTIQAGINACNALPAAYYQQCMIHVAPSQGGTGSGYAETVTFSQQGVNLVCDAPQRQTRACLISGQIVVNLIGVAGGSNFNATTNQVSMSGFVVSATTTTNALLFSGTTYQQFISDNNYFDQNGSVSSVVVSNSGVSGTGSTLYSYDTVYSNSNATNPTVSITSGARFWMYGTNSLVANGNASGPSVTQSGAGSSAIFNLVQITGQYNLSDNTSTATFNLSTIASGANPCIVTPSSPSTGYALLAYYGCNSTATNSITGTGVVVNSPGNIRLSTSGDIASTVTQSSFPGMPQGSVLIGNKAPSATNVLLSVFDGHIKASQTTAATAVVNANAGTSATCTLTNGRDHSGVINLTTGSASWVAGTQCTLTFNKAFATAPNCVLSPRNALAASKLVSQQIFNTTTTTTLVLTFGAADTGANAMQFWYSCWEP